MNTEELFDDLNKDSYKNSTYVNLDDFSKELHLKLKEYFNKYALYFDKKEKTVSVRCEGYNYPGIVTLKKLPKKRSDNPSHKSYVPPWYILK